MSFETWAEAAIKNIQESIIALNESLEILQERVAGKQGGDKRIGMYIRLNSECIGCGHFYVCRFIETRGAECSFREETP